MEETADPTGTVRVDVLGPLRLVVDGGDVDVRGPKRRAVLALLAMAEGRAVTADHLYDALWPAQAPASGRAALHSHVSRLRGHLGPAAARLETLDGAYRLVLADGGFDAALARTLLAEARAVADADPAGACVKLRRALALWRGPVLADLGDVAPIAASAVAFAQLHRDVTDVLVECAVAAGEAGGVVGAAADAVAAEPLREQAVLLLMQALAGTGRAAEALKAAHAHRRLLAEETGLDPSPALGELERRIAAGGPAAPAGALPRPAGRLIGRDAQVAALGRLIESERLVTVVGPGGVGKTRVALEVARRAEASTVLLLAPVIEPAALPHALAAALDLRLVHGDVLAACAALLGAGRSLLVVDNCEHLLDAVRDTVATLLDACPHLTVLATSREPLGLAAERPSRLAPLALPDVTTHRPYDPRAAFERNPSVAVFLDRAARVRPGFTPTTVELRLVADIVRHLDGIPLAIELAAGRLATFGLADLADRLDRSLDLLGGGRTSVDARHRTLRATVEWSYQLLPDDEQRLFRHLSVFADGVDLGTAEEVAADLGLAGDPAAALAHLVDASMIDASFDGRTRYRMLETLRAFGLDRLRAAAEDGEAHARLVRWAVALTGWIDRTVLTDREPRADAALRREVANLWAAWRLARRDGSLDAAVSMVMALYDVTSWRDVTEPWGWAEELAGDPLLPAHPRAAEVLGAAASVAWMRGDIGRAERLARSALALDPAPAGRAVALTSLALVHLSQGAFAGVVTHASAAADLGVRPAADAGIAALGATYLGDLDGARALLGRMPTPSPTLTGFGHYVAGEIDNRAGERDTAERHYADAAAAARTSGATFVAGVAAVGRLTLLADSDRIPDALRGYREVIDYWARTGNWIQQWTTLRNLAVLLERLGAHEPAAALLTAADHAPDAPAVGPDALPPPPSGAAPPLRRSAALEAARQAIDRWLAATA